MLRITRITGNAGSGKTSVLTCIEADMNSQGRHCMRICADDLASYVIRRVRQYLADTTDRFPLVILLDEANEEVIDAVRDAVAGRECFLYAAITE